MAGEQTSPNMSLILPGVGITIGPTWASDLNASLTILDGHNHSPGSGVPVTPSGLDISTDLTMKNNNLIGIKSLRLQIQTSPLASGSDLTCLYSSGVDLYFNDANGNQIQITQGGGVAGSPGSIGSLTSPASATYVSGSQTFVWQSAAATPANMDGASFIFRNLVASSKGLTLAPPNAMAADYSLVLPSLPASTKIMSLTSSGTMAAAYSVDNSTIEIASNIIQVKDAGITTAKYADASVTHAKMAALGQQISASSGNYQNFTSSSTAVTNLSCTLTTYGRPVMVVLIPDGNVSTVTPSCIAVSMASVAQVDGYFAILRDGIQISLTKITAYNPSVGIIIEQPPGSISLVDPVAAGTYVYTMESWTSGNPGNTAVRYCKLVAYEL